MAGPLFRVAVQVAVMAVGSLSRAFVAAYQQAAANGGRAAVKTAGRRGAISVKEAREILNLDTAAPLTEEAVLERFQHLFEVNDPDVGGSLYLRSKVFNAKEALMGELAAEKGEGASGAEGAGQQGSGGLDEDESRQQPRH